MTDEDDRIPIDGVHRGVGLHAGQTEARLVVVRRDIDAAHALQYIEELVAFADAPRNAPEARMLAKAKALAILDDAVERRAPRSRTTALDRQRVNASAVGLDSLRCRSTHYYCSIYDPGQSPGGDGRVRREVPLPPRQYNRTTPSN